MSHIHIPDGVLPLWLWAAGWVATFALLFVAARSSARSDVRRKVPLIGVIAALMLVAMTAEIVPIAYHLNLSVIGGILLGPPLSLIAAFIVVVVLAMLGHGGITVVGLNTLVIGAEMVLGWALFRAGVRVLKRERAGLAAALSTLVALALTTTMVVGIVWLAGTAGRTPPHTDTAEPAAGQPESHDGEGEGILQFHLFTGGHGPDGGHAHEATSLSAPRFAAIAYTLGPLGWLLEALVTAGVIGYVARVRPTMVFAGALAEEHRRIPGDESAAH